MGVRVGSYIKILNMEDPYSAGRYNGKEGTVTHIDERMGLIYGTWGGLAVIPDVDRYEVLEY